MLNYISQGVLIGAIVTVVVGLGLMLDFFGFKQRFPR